RLAALASLAAACPGQRSRTATALRPQPAQICPGHSRQCLLPHAYQRPGGCEQPHQGDQAHGLWLPGLSLLLPENQGRLPRESAMNRKKPSNAGLFVGEAKYRRCELELAWAAVLAGAAFTCCKWAGPRVLPTTAGRRAASRNGLTGAGRRRAPGSARCSNRFP